MTFSALTDALIAGIARGSDYKLVGSYVSKRRRESVQMTVCLALIAMIDSPLNWAIVAGKESKYESRGDLRGTTFGISRKGRSVRQPSSVPNSLGRSEP